MSEPFIGQIMPFCGNFQIRGWAFCNGQLMAIADNEALFAIIGTTYGGDGQVTFALPNLQSRIPIHMGQGPGLSPRTEGEPGGTETTALAVTQIPAHNHAVKIGVTSAGATAANPNGQIEGGGQFYQSPGSIDGGLAGVNCGQAGQNFPHNNLQPYLVINYLIATEGIFPSRN
jgi:microcystin-dependent protein